MQEDELTAAEWSRADNGATTTVASVHAALPDADIDPGRQFSLPEAVARLAYAAGVSGHAAIARAR
jgi:hypothetical protein